MTKWLPYLLELLALDIHEQKRIPNIQRLEVNGQALAASLQHNHLSWGEHEGLQA